jgi:hypothetical protein
MHDVNIVPFILQLIALGCFFCAFVGWFAPRQVQLIALGLFLWLLSLMVSPFFLHATQGVSH